MRRTIGMSRPENVSHHKVCGHSSGLDWTSLVKRVIARFSRGNIATQEGHVLLSEEQERERELARVIASRWRERASRARPRPSS